MQEENTLKGVQDLSQKKLKFFMFKKFMKWESLRVQLPGQDAE